MNIFLFISVQVFLKRIGRIYLVRLNHIRLILPTSLSLVILCGQNRPDMIDSDHIRKCSNTSHSMQSESTRYDCESDWTEISIYGQNRPDMIDSDHITKGSNNRNFMQSESTKYDCESDWIEIPIYGQSTCLLKGSNIFHLCLSSLTSQTVQSR